MKVTITLYEEIITMHNIVAITKTLTAIKFENTSGVITSYPREIIESLQVYV